MRLKRFIQFILILGVIAHFSCGSDDDPVTVTTADLTTSIDENPSNGDILGTVEGTTNRGTVTFSISSQTPPGAMAINATTGVLTVADASAFDFEVNPTITANVTVANGTVSQTAGITINLNNVSDAVTVADETLSIDENPTAGQTVTTAMATVDSGTPTFSISSQTPMGGFTIDASSGALNIMDASLFDFETNPTFTVVVTASLGQVSDDGTITVNLNNVLEEVTTQDETITIDENPTTGQSLVTVVGTTDMGSVTFSLANESVAGAFDLNTTTGELTVSDASLFDYELNTSLTATVNVTNANITETALITVNLNDVFELAWTEATTSAAFGGVYGHKIIEFNNKLWMLGGIRGINRLNEVWSSTDGINWTQETTSGIFSPRNGHQVVEFNSKLWVIGGFTPQGRSNEIYSSANGTDWTLENTSGIFSARADHAAVVFNGQIYVVGGSDGNMLNDVWTSSNGTSWTQVTTSSNIFTPRQAHTLTVFNGQMVLVAGADRDADQLIRYRNDIWTSSNGTTWTEVNVSGNLFVERWIHGTIVHDGLLWVIGGDDDSANRFNDVWTSPDGLTWTQQNANPVFDPRDQMALFVLDGSVWVSGGSNNGGILTDIWKSN